ncbi:MAG TPA: hypothetical protein VF045_09800 [Acidimicrobiales bacterium]
MQTIPRASRYLAAAAVTVTLALAGCTGVQDEKGWRKALTKDYPCSELIDIAEDLPSSVDPEMVDEDLRQRGCDPSTLSNR